MMILRRIVASCVFLGLFAGAQAKESVNPTPVSNRFVPDGLSLSYGKGIPNNLHGGRVGLQWDWHVDWLQKSPLQLSGYWDFNVAHWLSNGDEYGKNPSIWAIGFNPIFHLQTRRPWWDLVSPYLEGSVGVAWLTTTHIGCRDLGSHLTFEDLIGLGFRFGSRQQFDVSYHFLHYSNASFAPPNQGIDVKTLLTFAYRWN
jgi:lipid A 3-O-deacylase